MKIFQIQCTSFIESKWEKSKCSNCFKFHSNINTNNSNNTNNKEKEKDSNNNNFKYNKNNKNNNIEKIINSIENNNIKKPIVIIKPQQQQQQQIQQRQQLKVIREKEEGEEEQIEEMEPTLTSTSTILKECLEFKSHQWRPNICITCFLPKTKHKNVLPDSTGTPLISQSSQTSTITPSSSSTSTSTSSISTHKTANNKTVITYISSTTTTTTTSSLSPPSSSIGGINSRSSSPILKSVSPSAVSNVVVPPLTPNNNTITKSMSTPGSPILSRKVSGNTSSSSQPSSTIVVSSSINGSNRPVLKRQYLSFPSNPKISKATLETPPEPIILCKYTIESQPKSNISILKPTLVEFINQPDSKDDELEAIFESNNNEIIDEKPIFNSKQSATMDGITTHKSVSITISTLTSPSSTTTTTSTTTSIIAEEPSSPLNASVNSVIDTPTSSIPMSPSLPSIPIHAFESDLPNPLLGCIGGGNSNSNSKRNSMNILPLRLKSFSFSAPQSDSMVSDVEEYDDPFFDFEDLSDDECDEEVDESKNSSRIIDTILPSTTITSTTTILQSPNLEKTLSTTTTSSSTTTIPSPTTNSRSISNALMDSTDSVLTQPVVVTPVIPVSTTTTTTTTTKRRSIKMDQFKEKEDEWDQGVDLTSFLKKKPALQRDFSYYNNKVMEISSVKEEAKRLHVGTGYFHSHAFEAFKDILEAKQTQINRAFCSQKIDEPDCHMLIDEINSAKKLLDELLELNDGSSENGNNSENSSPSNSNNNTLNQQSICIKSE